MSKKLTKTTEELTEDFFAAEREEYEKRVPKAFPRVAVKAQAEKQVEESAPAEAAEKSDDEQKPARKSTN